MPGASEFLDKGVALVKEAIAADTAKDYALAYAKYKQALEYLVAFLKRTWHDESRCAIAQRPILSLTPGDLWQMLLRACRRRRTR